MEAVYQPIESGLMKIDYELHTLMGEVRVSNKSVTLEKLIREIESNLVEDTDTADILKEMRKKEYDI